MKPTIGIAKTTFEQGNLCHIILLARTAMLNTAAREARSTKTKAFEIGLARMDADKEAIKMAERCLHVKSFAEAMEIVKEYVDVEII